MNFSKIVWVFLIIFFTTGCAKKVPQSDEQKFYPAVNITDSPPDVLTVQLGERAEMECQAAGSHYPDIEWFKGNLSVSVGMKGLRSNGGTYIRSRLVIPCVKKEDEGLYTCSGTSGSKSIQSKPTHLQVEGIDHGELESCSAGQLSAPRITYWNNGTLTMLGGTIDLPCRAIGNPQPRVTWMDPYNNTMNPMTHKINEDGMLTVAQLVFEDMGIYTCRAENSEGIDEIESFLYPYSDD